MLRKRARLEEEEDFEGSWTEIKYARKAELAKKCRARKKVYIEGLEETVQRLNNAITIKELEQIRIIKSTTPSSVKILETHRGLMTAIERPNPEMVIMSLFSRLKCQKEDDQHTSKATANSQSGIQFEHVPAACSINLNNPGLLGEKSRSLPIAGCPINRRDGALGDESKPEDTKALFQSFAGSLAATSLPAPQTLETPLTMKSRSELGSFDGEITLESLVAWLELSEEQSAIMTQAREKFLRNLLELVERRKTLGELLLAHHQLLQSDWLLYQMLNHWLSPEQLRQVSMWVFRNSLVNDMNEQFKTPKNSSRETLPPEAPQITTSTTTELVQ